MVSDTKDIRAGCSALLTIVPNKSKTKNISAKPNLAASCSISDIERKKSADTLYIQNISPKHFFRAEVFAIAGAGIMIVFLINLLSVFGQIPLIEKSLASDAKQGFQLIAAAKNENDFDRAIEIFQKISHSPFLNNSYVFSFELRKEEAAKHLADAGISLGHARKTFLYVKKSFADFSQEFSHGFAKPLAEREKVSPALTALERFFDSVQSLSADISQAERALSRISLEILPARYRPYFSALKDIVSRSKSDIEHLLDHKNAFFSLLGKDRPHRIMIAFQNNQEIRPTGGFIGSFLLLEFDKGYVANQTFHDVYEFDNRFRTFIEPPEELKSLTKSWELRDSNFSPDFRVSGEKMAWFLEQEGGPNVDTVFAVNLKTLGKLLELTGPMVIPELSAPITAENYDTALTFLVETKQFGYTAAKDPVKYLIPALQNRLFQLAKSGKTQQELFETLLTIQSEKQVLAYSRKKSVENLFAAVGIDGKVPSPAENEDYLQVVFTSIAGTKSDRYVTTNVSHETSIEDGKIKNRVMVTRAHTWNKKEIASYKRLLEPFGATEIKSHLIDIMGRGKNTVNVRLYVPKGSLAISDVLQKYDSELGKTYFSFPMTVEAGETDTFSVEYFLPFEMDDASFFTYRLRADSQAGMWNPVRFQKTFVEKAVISYPEFPVETWLKEPLRMAALFQRP